MVSLAVGLGEARGLFIYSKRTYLFIPRILNNAKRQTTNGYLRGPESQDNLPLGLQHPTSP